MADEGRATQMNKNTSVVMAALTAVMGAHAMAAENFQKLSGVQIRAKIVGMQMTDEVHWSYFYDRNGV